MGCKPVKTVTMRLVAISFVLVLLFASGCSQYCRTAPEPGASRDVTAAETPPKTTPALRQAEPTSPPKVEESPASAPPTSSGERPQKAAPERIPAAGTTPVAPGPPNVTAAPALDEPTGSMAPEAAMEAPEDGNKEPLPVEPPEQQPPEQQLPEQQLPEQQPPEQQPLEQQTAEQQPKEQPKKQKEAVEPPLDLESLEQRLRETKAIGVFTKLALKNQVDDLMDKFRDYYKGRSNSSLTQLRQPYEMLILKVLALLQDRDPKLARDLLESREAIWKVLSDQEKFTSI